jgi:hypothetical protein
MWQTQQSNIPNFTMGGLNHPRLCGLWWFIVGSRALPSNSWYICKSAVYIFSSSTLS